MNSNSTEKILSYLVDINSQKYSLTEDDVLNETDPNTQLILAGILNLSDELQYLEEEKKKSLEGLVERKKLERANRELNDFAYLVSHDLKSPLRGIANIAQWMHDDYHDKIDKEGKGFLNLMVEKVKKLERLIEDILDYSKVGRREDKIVDVNLKSIVETVIVSLSFSDKFSFEVLDLPTVSGIETEWHQVFSNLLSNAINYNDKEYGEVIIESKLDEERLFITVCDNGPGIPAKHQKKVFEIFRTLNVDYNPDSTGVGLSTVKKIIELNDGDIYVKSDGVSGTCFMIELHSSIVIDTA